MPALQERGAYRTEYEEGATLRDLLGLPAPRATVPLTTPALATR